VLRKFWTVGPPTSKRSVRFVSDFGERWLVARPIGYLMVLAIGWASSTGERWSARSTDWYSEGTWYGQGRAAEREVLRGN
jgi:hypothetical protein